MAPTERSPLLSQSNSAGRTQPTTLQSLKSLLLYSPVNVLLLAVPFSFASHFAGWGATATFITSFLAIVPLAGLLGEATEQVALKVGESLGGLLNATFGNAVEAIVGIVALQQNQLRIVQTSMLGSVLSNLLLVLGCSFWAAGKNYKQAEFRMTAAQTKGSVLMLAGATLIIPAAYHSSTSGRGATPPVTMSAQELAVSLMTPLTTGGPIDNGLKGLLVISRFTSVILLLMYFGYLYFELYSHADLFEAENAQEEEEESKMNLWTAIGSLIAVTVVTAFCADYLVDSIDEFSTKLGVPKVFIGFILLPIVGNAAEHLTAVWMAMKGRMELTLAVAVGSSIQISIGVIPILVLIGWAMGRDLTLYFENFETICFFLSVLLVNLVISDGLSNYLEGAMLVALYLVIAVSMWVY